MREKKSLKRKKAEKAEKNPKVKEVSESSQPEPEQNRKPDEEESSLFLGSEDETGEETKEETEGEPREEIKEEFLRKEEDYGSGASGKAILIMVLVIIGIFAFSFLGFKYYNQLTAGDVINIDEMHQENLEEELGEGEGYLYNGYSFVYADGLWWTEMDKFGTRLKVPLHFSPKELEDVPIEGELSPRFNLGKGVYVAINPNVYDKYYTLAVSELSFNLVKGMDRLPEGACTEENYVCDNRSVVSCAHNPLNRPVVELAYEAGPGIELNGSCIKVKGNSEYDIVKSVNRLLYQWYGIMD